METVKKFLRAFPRAILVLAVSAGLAWAGSNYTVDTSGNQTQAGDLKIHGANDIIGYSDTGSSPVYGLYGSDGRILGAPQTDGAYGVTISGPSSGIVTLGCSGSSCSSSNPAYIRMRAASGTGSVTLPVTSGGAFTDDSGASDLTNLGFGITETVAWAQFIPYFIYACNRGDAPFDGADGSSVFVLARNPAMSTLPSDANNIGDTGAIPVNDSEHVVLILDDVTVANYVSLRCLRIGALRMTWSTITDDWTVDTLGATDGIGAEALNATFANHWNFPNQQHGASSGTVFLPNGGAAPVFSTNQEYYLVGPDGVITVDGFFDGDGGTDGSGAVETRMSLPTRYWRRAGANTSDQAIGTAFGATTISGGTLVIATFTHNTQYIRLFYQSAVTSINSITNSMFSNGSRGVAVRFSYQGFDTTP